MRALVTGASGFVGANLTARLVHDGHEVHVVCRGNRDEWRLARLTEVLTHHADLIVPGTASRLMKDVAPDWVFHLAAYGAYSWQTEVARIIDTNLSATVALVDAAERQGVGAFVNAGSSSEYGFKDHAPDEDERPDPNSAYAVAKAAATMYCRYRAGAAGLPAVTLRLYSVYGALEDRRRLVPTLISHGLRGQLPPLVAPDTARDFIYVDDVCEAFVQAAERSSLVRGGIFNVGSGRQTTLRQLVDCARDLMVIPAEPSWGSYPPRIWDTSVWYANTTRTTRELGWSAKTGVEDGLRRTIAAMSDSLSSRGDGQRARPRPSSLTTRRGARSLRGHIPTVDVEVRDGV